MKLYLAQIDTTVGDLDGNVSKILSGIDDARRLAAEIAIFPELAVTGYPPRDLVEKRTFVQDNLLAVDKIANAARGVAAIVGFVAPNDAGSGNGLFNAAAFCADGRVRQVVAKCLLPTYDVFDEGRHFDPGPGGAVVEFEGRRLGISICEDFWNDPAFWGRHHYQRDPIAEQVAKGAEILINISASPFAIGRRELRERLLSGHARRHHRPAVCVNLVGGNDELLFDGRSHVLDARGFKTVELAGFREDAALVEIEPAQAGASGAGRSAAPATARAEPNASGEASADTDGRPSPAPGGGDRRSRSGSEIGTSETGPSPPFRGSPRAAAEEPPPGPETAAEAYEALVMGTRDYVLKCGFSSVVLGLSGGIDSSLVAAIATAALGPSSVTGVSMPSRYSSKGSLEDADSLAKNLGIARLIVPIEGPFTALLETLAPTFAGLPQDVTEENLQARIRGTLLMALSNKFGWLVLTTGNKSELAVGYSTLYGDMSGGLAVISDVPKTLVYAMARHANRERELIPAPVFTKAPSAELRPGQTDRDSLPPYETLDAILRLYVEELLAADEIVAAGFDRDTVREVARRVDASEYKRKQAPPGLRITTKAFGLGRRMPIAQRYLGR